MSIRLLLQRSMSLRVDPLAGIFDYGSPKTPAWHMPSSRVVLGKKCFAVVTVVMSVLLLTTIQFYMVKESSFLNCS